MEYILAGFRIGALVALFGLGFQLAYMPTRIFHISLAGIFLIAPYLVWQATVLNLSPFWACAFAGLVVFILAVGVGFQHELLVKKGSGPGVHLVASLGLFIILQQATALLWGTEPHELSGFWFDVDPEQPFNYLFQPRVGTGVLALLLLSAIYLALWRSRLGLLLRGLASNPVQFEVAGMNSMKTRISAIVLSSLITGFASILWAIDLRFGPELGMNELLMAVVAVIVGGRLSFFGPLVGGVSIGILHVVTISQFSSQWNEAAMFFLLVSFLIFRPNGILGQIDSEEPQ